MSNFQQIVLKGEGHFDEGMLAGTGYDPVEYAWPGMGIQINSDGEYEIGIGASDGAFGAVKIVVEDNLVGKTVTDAYYDGSRVRFYTPLPGDEVLLLVKAGENVVIGDQLIMDTSEGLWIKTTGTPKQQPFEVMESSDGALAEDSLLICRRI